MWHLSTYHMVNNIISCSIVIMLNIDWCMRLLYLVVLYPQNKI